MILSLWIFFLAFNYTIVSKLSQLLKIDKKTFTLTYFMRCLEIIFLAVNASNLIKKDTIGKEIEKRNKQNLFISQGILLPEK